MVVRQRVTRGGGLTRNRAARFCVLAKSRRQRRRRWYTGVVPKRSNDFQRVIKRIHDQLVPTGASVRESVELEERGSGKRREIDVLIEYQAIDSPTRIAVECRDRSRLSDIEWIDALIGKFRDLHVHQIIAVSSKGFTKGAEEKATSSDPRIELRSLRHALDADWPAELARIGMAGIGTNVAFVRTRLVTDPPWSSTAPPGRVSVDGKEQTFPDFFQDCIKAARSQLSQAFMDAGRDVVKTMGDLKKARYEQEVMITANKPTTFQSAAGEQHRLVSMTCNAVVTAMVVDVPVERQLYGAAKVGVSSGVIVRDDGIKFRVLAIQVPGREVTPHIDRIETNRRKPRPRKTAGLTTQRTVRSRRNVNSKKVSN